jgi:hypothetical protein
MKKLPPEEAAQVPGGVMAPDPEEIPVSEYPQLPGGCTNPPTN